MILRMVPDRLFEVAGTVAGLSAVSLIAVQIVAELSSNAPSTMSVWYVAGFLLIFVFWTLYGVRFGRSALWLTNGLAALLQTVLLIIILVA